MLDTAGPLPVKHIKSLDGIRAIAALLVVFFHSPVDIFTLRFGWMGVNLFFILSGFLITRILLAQEQKPLLSVLKRFYSRRALRILPLYFFYLIFISLVLFGLNGILGAKNTMVKEGLSDLANNSSYLYTLTYNFQSIVHFWAGKSYSNSVFFGHLWTLSVEVQFYFVFPFVLHFIKLRWLKRILIMTIPLTTLLRLVFVLFLRSKVNDMFWIGQVLYESTPFQWDAFSMGILIGLFDNENKSYRHSRYFLIIALLFLCVAGAVNMYYLRLFGFPVDDHSLGLDNPVYHLIYPVPNFWIRNRYLFTIPIIDLFFALLLIVVKSGNFLPRLFENTILTLFGRVSYGIYIYHLAFSYFFGSAVLIVFGKGLSSFSVLQQAGFMSIYLGLLFGIAGLSYYGFERRFTARSSSRNRVRTSSRGGDRC